MHFLFFFTLAVTIVIIPNTFSGTPGDPFPAYLNVVVTSSTNPQNISNETLSSDKHIPVNTLVNKNETNDILFSSTPKSSQEALQIYKKHLIKIAQWKHTDPKTNQIRYWYYSIDSEMGNGWIQDGIIFQVYSRQKPDTVPIHVFHSEAKGSWTNILQLESTLPPIGNNQWKYDGTPFYAYKTSMNSTLLKPVWRYWNRINQGTEDVREPRRALLRIGDTANYNSSDWTVDRILFYAFTPHINEINK